jgi:VWFA-related protein
MTLRAAILGLVLVSAAAAAAAVPQERRSTPEDAGQNQIPTITVPVNLVNVLFTVTDKKGKLISGLTKDDFKISEDGIPQSVAGFNSEPDPPLTIALLIDASGSIRDKLKFEQAAASDFFQYTLVRKKDRGVVISFDSGVDLLTPEFTDNAGNLRDALYKVRPGGGTSMLDALFLAVNGDEQWTGLNGQAGRRVIVVISDGDDNFSRISLATALEAVQLNDVAIYAISTNSNFFLGAAQPSAAGEKALRRLTEETGGQTFLPETEKELFESFDRIRQDLRTLYTIGYKSTNEKTDGTFRKIRIELVARNKDYRVRHRTGYYGPRPTPPAVESTNRK